MWLFGPAATSLLDKFLGNTSIFDITVSINFNFCIFRLLNNWKNLNLKQVKRLNYLFIGLEFSANIQC